MGNHIQITFTALQPEQQDILIAHLAEAGYEGFEEDRDELKAFIPEASYDRSLLKEFAFKYQVSYQEQKIEEQNWNAIWESGFQPVVIGEFAGIRAGFHPPLENLEHEIVITPKMSFGTGHHATTCLMIRQMQSIDFTGHTVFDFGTGTGILAILAEKLGAGKVVAVDHDDWSISNAADNLERNNCRNIILEKATGITGTDPYTIILANINRNIILENFPVLVERLAQNGVLLLSGLLEEDEPDILLEAKKYSLQLVKKTVENNWICLRFSC